MLAMLDIVKVDVYGQKMPINQLGKHVQLFQNLEL